MNATVAVALLGILGTLAAGLAGRWLELRHERSRWLRDKRLEAHLEFTRSVTSILAAYALMRNITKEEVPAALAEHAARVQRLQDAQLHVRLLATKRTYDLAWAVTAATDPGLLNFFEYDQMMQLSQRIAEAHRAYLVAAQAELT